MAMELDDKNKNKMKTTVGGGGGGSETNIPPPPVVIYFVVDGNDGERWYAININSSYSSSSSDYNLSGYTFLDPALPPRPVPIPGSSLASIGSVIYSAGGVDPPPDVLQEQARIPFSPSNRVFYMDTFRPEQGWKETRPMNSKRMQPYLVATDDGKIYALGGLNKRRPPDPEDGKRLFAEVYDPHSNAWYELARIGDDQIIPQSINGHAVVDHGNSDRKILFHNYFRKELFYLHTALHNDVGAYDDNFGKYHTKSAFLDGILYFMSYHTMRAYDVSSGRQIPVHLRDARPNTLPICDLDGSTPAAYLLSLGNGYLALIWAGDECYTCVHCSILEMSKVGDTLEGKVLDCTSYLVEPDTIFVKCMAVFSPEEDVSLDTKLGQSTDNSNKQLQLRKKQHKRKRDEVGSDQLPFVQSDGD